MVSFSLFSFKSRLPFKLCLISVQEGKFRLRSTKLAFERRLELGAKIKMRCIQIETPLKLSILPGSAAGEKTRDSGGDEAESRLLEAVGVERRHQKYLCVVEKSSHPLKNVRLG